MQCNLRWKWHSKMQQQGRDIITLQEISTQIQQTIDTWWVGMAPTTCSKWGGILYRRKMSNSIQLREKWGVHHQCSGLRVWSICRNVSEVEFHAMLHLGATDGRWKGPQWWNSTICEVFVWPLKKKVLLMLPEVKNTPCWEYTKIKCYCTGF